MSTPSESAATATQESADLAAVLFGPSQPRRTPATQADLADWLAHGHRGDDKAGGTSGEEDTTTD